MSKKSTAEKFTPAVVVRPAPPQQPQTRCNICGLIEMDCVGHLGLFPHLLTFNPGGEVKHADKME